MQNATLGAAMHCSAILARAKIANASMKKFALTIRV
jgi:hypothetical protein